MTVDRWLRERGSAVDGIDMDSAMAADSRGFTGLLGRL